MCDSTVKIDIAFIRMGGWLLSDEEIGSLTLTLKQVMEHERQRVEFMNKRVVNGGYGGSGSRGAAAYVDGVVSWVGTFV